MGSRAKGSGRLKSSGRSRYPSREFLLLNPQAILPIARDHAKMRFTLIRPGITLVLILAVALLGTVRLTADQPMMASSGLTAVVHTDSGEIQNAANTTRSVFMDVIHEPSADWLRLSLAGTQLEDNSVIKVQSLLDGEVQYLGTRELQTWSRTSAYSMAARCYGDHRSPGTTNRSSSTRLWNDARDRDEQAWLRLMIVCPSSTMPSAEFSEEPIPARE